MNPWLLVALIERLIDEVRWWHRGRTNRELLNRIATQYERSLQVEQDWLKQHEAGR